MHNPLNIDTPPVQHISLLNTRVPLLLDKPQGVGPARLEANSKRLGRLELSGVPGIRTGVERRGALGRLDGERPQMLGLLTLSAFDIAQCRSALHKTRPSDPHLHVIKKIWVEAKRLLRSNILQDLAYGSRGQSVKALRFTHDFLPWSGICLSRAGIISRSLGNQGTLGAFYTARAVLPEAREFLAETMA